MTETQPDVYRKLHHLGVFMLGLAALITCVYFVFFHRDPAAIAQERFTEHFLRELNTTPPPKASPTIAK